MRKRAWSCRLRQRLDTTRGYVAGSRIRENSDACLSGCNVQGPTKSVGNRRETEKVETETRELRILTPFQSPHHAARQVVGRRRPMLQRIDRRNRLTRFVVDRRRAGLNGILDLHRPARRVVRRRRPRPQRIHPRNAPTRRIVDRRHLPIHKIRDASATSFALSRPYLRDIEANHLTIGKFDNDSIITRNMQPHDWAFKRLHTRSVSKIRVI